jgi:serine protease inhibitor
MKYKKGLTSIITIFSMSLLFSGCSKANTSNEKVIINTTSKSDSRFVTSEYTYLINNEKYNIIYDSETDNVYLSSNRAYGNDTFPMLDENGKPMKYKNLK